MSKSTAAKHTQPRPLHEPSPSAEPWAWLTRLAFFGAIGLVAARLTMTDSLRDAFDVIPGGPPVPRAPGPAVGLLLDLFCCLPALLVLLRRMLDRTYVLRWSWSMVLAGAFGLWTFLSFAWASDRFAAIVLGGHFLAGVVLLWSMAQLVRSWGRLRIVAGACAGLLLVLVVYGLNYRLVDFPQTVKEWNDPSSPTGRAAYLKQNHLEPDSFTFRQFEKKLLSGELIGFYQSANTMGAVLVLLSLVTAGVMIQRLVRREGLPEAAALGIVILGMVAALAFTRSRTAFLTFLAGGAILLLLAWAGRWLGDHSRRAYWIAVAGFVVGVAAVIGHGAYHGNLVEKSLTFRWYYWVGAARIWKQHPVLGVGEGNFGLFYPAVRVAQATEEVKDPHGFVVKAFVELGAIGGMLIIAWMLRLWWELTRPNRPSEGKSSSHAIAAFGLMAAGAAVLSLALATDFSQDSSWVLLQVLAAIAGAVLMVIGMGLGAIDSWREGRIDARESPWLLYGLLVGLGMFLAHNLIDFSLSETGPMFLFMILAGSALGVRQGSVAGQRKKNAVATAMFCVACAAWVGFAVLVWGRTAMGESSAARGDELLRTSVVGDRANIAQMLEAAAAYHSAFAAQPLNGEYACREAQALISAGGPDLRIRGAINSAIAANPAAGKYHILLGGYALGRNPPDETTFRSAFQRSLALDPRDVGLRIRYADGLAKLGDHFAAAEEYREALRQDDLLPKDEPKRLPPARREEIHKKIRDLG